MRLRLRIECSALLCSVRPTEPARLFLPRATAALPSPECRGTDRHPPRRAARHLVVGWPTCLPKESERRAAAAASSSFGSAAGCRRVQGDAGLVVVRPSAVSELGDRRLRLMSTEQQHYFSASDGPIP